MRGAPVPRAAEGIEGLARAAGVALVVKRTEEIQVSRSAVESLVIPNTTKIVLLVLDGLGDLPNADRGRQTPLEAARTPNLDALAPEAALGRLLPVEPGVTPGSGPGHLGLFGYDPLTTPVGRGVLEALGAGMDLKPGDVAARANFCTLDASGIVTDRRAGRIASEKCAELVARLQKDATRFEDVDVVLKSRQGTSLRRGAARPGPGRRRERRRPAQGGQADSRGARARGRRGQREDGAHRERVRANAWPRS